MSHTAGKWRVVENGGRMVGVMSGHKWITYKAGNDQMTTEEIEANARLIAAAPKLLKALKNLMGRLDFYDYPDEQGVARTIIADITGS